MDNLPVNQQLHPIHKVSERVTGKRPAPATCWRWVHKGCRGVKLRAVQLGNQWLCSEDAFRAFIDEQTQAAMNRHSDGDVTDEQLRAEGLL